MAEFLTDYLSSQQRLPPLSVSNVHLHRYPTVSIESTLFSTLNNVGVLRLSVRVLIGRIFSLRDTFTIGRDFDFDCIVIGLHLFGICEYDHLE